MRTFLLSSASAAILAMGALTLPALADSPSLQAHPPGQLQLADSTVIPEGDGNSDINASEETTGEPTTDAPEGLSTESEPLDGTTGDGTTGDDGTGAAEAPPLETTPDSGSDGTLTETLDAEPADEAAEVEEPDPSEIPTGQLAAEPVQPAGTVTADELLSAEVIDVNGEGVASVYEVLMDPNGQITHVVVSYGGFIGIGTKEVLVPWETVSYNAAQATLQLPATEADLDAAPSYMTQEEYSREQEAEQQADAPAPSGVPQQAETPPESEPVD